VPALNRRRFLSGDQRGQNGVALVVMLTIFLDSVPSAFARYRLLESEAPLHYD